MYSALFRVCCMPDEQRLR